MKSTLLAILCFVVTTILLEVGECGGRKLEQAKAIEANAAHYDSKTGEIVYGCEEKK